MPHMRAHGFLLPPRKIAQDYRVSDYSKEIETSDSSTPPLDRPARVGDLRQNRQAQCTSSNFHVKPYPLIGEFYEDALQGTKACGLLLGAADCMAQVNDCDGKCPCRGRS
jgi:hypothetical protein